VSLRSTHFSEDTRILPGDILLIPTLFLIDCLGGSMYILFQIAVNEASLGISGVLCHFDLGSFILLLDSLKRRIDGKLLILSSASQVIRHVWFAWEQEESLTHFESVFWVQLH
jgi:hypothetical protein